MVQTPDRLPAAPITDRRLCAVGGGSVDGVRLVPATPSGRVRPCDGLHLDHAGDARAMRDESDRFNPADAVGRSTSMARSEAAVRIGSERFGDTSFRHCGTRPGTGLPRILFSPTVLDQVAPDAHPVSADVLG